MAVSATPSISELVTEFGGAGTLSTYVRNGAFVPTNHTTETTVATAVPLSLLSFANTTSFLPAVSAHTIADVGADPQIAQAGLIFDTDGQMTGLRNIVGNVTYTGEWGAPLTVGVGSNYEVLVTVTGDAVAGSGVWTPLSSLFQINYTQNTPGNQTGTWDVDIRIASTLTVVASATGFAVSATVT